MINKDLKKELQAVEKKEQKLLCKVEKENKIKDTIYEKVPKGVSDTLEAAFAKAFHLVFTKGTAIIEKTFDKEESSLEFEAGNYIVNKAGNKKSIRRLDKGAKKNSGLNHAVTTFSGFGMGILGMGLPDIPLLVSTVLKGIYEIAIGYGFSYESEEEKVYILRLIHTALANGEEKQTYNSLLDSIAYEPESLEKEIAATAKVLSDSLLVEKFVQGLPIVGVVGGFVNHAVYGKIAAFAAVKYKKRYLISKL